MKIGYASLDWSNYLDSEGLPTPGGANYYRCYLPSKVLAENGVDTVIGMNLASAPDGSFVIQDLRGDLHYDCDIIVLQRCMKREAPVWIKRARSAGQVVINDCDDWYEGLDQANAAFWASHPRVNPEENRNHYSAALAASSALTVSTPYLAQRLQKYGRPTFVVPNHIDLARWEQRDVSGQMVVGWVGATGYRSRDIEELRGILKPFLIKNDIAFEHAGADRHAKGIGDILHFDGAVQLGEHQQSSILEYPKMFSTFNVGIVPLSDRPFNQAKSNIKGLEYSASGIPFIASKTQEYERLKRAGAGLVAKRPRDWIRCLEMLLDSERRVTLGEQARVSVAAFDIANGWTRWQTAYERSLALAT